MKKGLYIIIASTLLIGIAIFLLGRNSANQAIDQIEINPTTNPIILIIVDSLMDQPLQEAMKKGKAPAFKFLADNGHYYSDIISSYPTMSVSIDSTLLTGKYPDEHHIPGLVWFNTVENRLVNYGSAKEEIIKLGIKQVVEDHFYHLNHTHLNSQTKTIHEVLANNGLQSGSINALVYRGEEKNEINLSKVLANFDVMPESITVETPSIFSYGAFAQYSPKNKENTQIWERYGFNDQFASEELKHVINHNKLPAFSIVYFSDLDKAVHQDGPTNHINAIEKADKQLQQVLDMYDSWEEAIQSNVWMVMGDSGQAPVKMDKEESLISLHSILDPSYKIHKPAEPVQDDDQLVFALNERMAYVYNLDVALSLEDIARKLQKDSRINFIAWKIDDQTTVIQNGKPNALTFQPKGNLRDQYGQTWAVNGDLSILDLNKNEDSIDYGDYPDALARLHSASESHKGEFVIIDAKPGYEFIGEGTPTHPGGGSHGSLHEEDSVVPVIVAGTDLTPGHNRIVDFKKWIEEIVLTNNK
ncbi:Predicted pyrophosphatase or phosphodiesterase, AlkP superfamily [Oceanobacillus limi]|uniref:Predicted pyrophosphatase or phosphodiesterase, AlkP superfamily n=1 Tax=Oceanobacillus limi TaxID=930131 RepID=A0A1I0F8N9_9BACI|nr:alkaline phosphatase family protein [Oceanobacillus limi]SET54449.1 Predicted pyrophosphatase or phosphodiesterase, AlkP superfamily [Oceanobacillus limi]